MSVVLLLEACVNIAQVSIQSCERLINLQHFSVDRRQLTYPVSVTWHHPVFPDTVKPECTLCKSSELHCQHRKHSKPCARQHTLTHPPRHTHAGWWLVSSSNLSPSEYSYLFGVSIETKPTNEIGCGFLCVYMSVCVSKQGQVSLGAGNGEQLCWGLFGVFMWLDRHTARAKIRL